MVNFDIAAAGGDQTLSEHEHQHHRRPIGLHHHQRHFYDDEEYLHRSTIAYQPHHPGVYRPPGELHALRNDAMKRDRSTHGDDGRDRGRPDRPPLEGQQALHIAEDRGLCRLIQGGRSHFEIGNTHATTCHRLPHLTTDTIDTTKTDEHANGVLKGVDVTTAPLHRSVRRGQDVIAAAVGTGNAPRDKASTTCQSPIN
ncbi:hypothetical protein PG995_013683 [Apiospora arundinis]